MLKVCISTDTQTSFQPVATALDTTPLVGALTMRNGVTYMIRLGLCPGESNITGRKRGSLNKNIVLWLGCTPFYLFLWTSKLAGLENVMDLLWLDHRGAIAPIPSEQASTKNVVPLRQVFLYADLSSI